MDITYDHPLKQKNGETNRNLPSITMSLLLCITLFIQLLTLPAGVVQVNASVSLFDVASWFDVPSPYQYFVASPSTSPPSGSNPSPYIYPSTSTATATTTTTTTAPSSPTSSPYQQPSSGAGQSTIPSASTGHYVNPYANYTLAGLISCTPNLTFTTVCIFLYANAHMFSCVSRCYCCCTHFCRTNNVFNSVQFYTILYETFFIFSLKNQRQY
jgi:hypothetical protein